MTGRDHLTSGLSHKLVDGDGVVVTSAWQRAYEGREIVGTCRQPMSRGKTCDGFMSAAEAYRDEGTNITWHEATCMKCQHLVALPNGKTLPRSSRRQEMPTGAWDIRFKAITARFGKAV